MSAPTTGFRMLGRNVGAGRELNLCSVEWYAGRSAHVCNTGNLAVSETLIYISPWVLGSVCVGLGIGFFLGRSNRTLVGRDQANPDRDATMKILLEVLQEMERVTGDVHERNSEIRQTAQDVDGMVVTPEMREIKQAVIGQVSKLLESNQELESNLLYTQYRVQEQAQEIDSARREARTDSLTGVANRKSFDFLCQVLLFRTTSEVK